MEDVQDALAVHQEQRLKDGEACLEAALFYLSLGWSVLCICPPDHASVGKGHAKNCDSPGKSPFGEWKEFQDRRATESELREKWEVIPGANVGMAMGPVSGLIRVDVEGESGEKALQVKSGGDLPDTLEFKSGRKDGTGRGLLYRIPDGANLRTTSEKHGKKQELRFQARGAQTVLPPSRHVDGNIYSWKPGHSPGQMQPAMAPAWLVAELTIKSEGGNRKEGGKKLEDIIDGVEEGQRNESAASFIGRLFLTIDVNNQSAVRLQWKFTQLWNQQNSPQLDENELRNTFNSILKLDRERIDRLDQEKLQQHIDEQVQRSLGKMEEAKTNGTTSLNGDVKSKINGHAIPLPDWHLVIIESDPKEFRLRAPYWKDSQRLHNGYIVLNERQIRIWNNSTEGIPQAAYSQALETTDPVFKNWAKPGGTLETLTKGAVIIPVAPESKRYLYMLGFFYRYLDGARPALQDDGSVVWPVSGRPTIRQDLAVCFKLDNLKKSISYHKEEFQIRNMTKLLEEKGVTQGIIDNSRWWIVPPTVVKEIGEVTLESI